MINRMNFILILDSELSEEFIVFAMMSVLL